MVGGLSSSQPQQLPGLNSTPPPNASQPRSLAPSVSPLAQPLSQQQSPATSVSPAAKPTPPPQSSTPGGTPLISNNIGGGGGRRSHHLNCRCSPQYDSREHICRPHSCSTQRQLDSRIRHSIPHFFRDGSPANTDCLLLLQFIFWRRDDFRCPGNEFSDGDAASGTGHGRLPPSPCSEPRDGWSRDARAADGPLSEYDAQPPAPDDDKTAAGGAPDARRSDARRPPAAIHGDAPFPHDASRGPADGSWRDGDGRWRYDAAQRRYAHEPWDAPHVRCSKDGHDGEAWHAPPTADHWTPTRPAAPWDASSETSKHDDGGPPPPVHGPLWLPEPHAE